MNKIKIGIVTPTVIPVTGNVYGNLELLRYFPTSNTVKVRFETATKAHVVLDAKGAREVAGIFLDLADKLDSLEPPAKEPVKLLPYTPSPAPEMVKAASDDVMDATLAQMLGIPVTLIHEASNHPILPLLPRTSKERGLTLISDDL